MRKTGLIGLVVFSLLWVGGSSAQNLLYMPESVAFDTLNNRYLVSNAGDAAIIQIEDDFVTQSYYKTALGQYCLGNHISDDVFYVSVFPRNVMGFDLTTDEQIMNLIIPLANSLDGMTTDTSGNLYVLETQYRRIFKILLSDYSISTFVQGLPTSPQDITFDAENNRLLICCYFDDSPVLAVSLPDGAISTLVVTTMGFFDGITHDGNGNTYLATHSSGGRVYMYDENFTNPPTLITNLPIEPAGLDWNFRDNILAIPSFGGNKVDFLSFNDPDEDGILDYLDNCPNDYNPNQEDDDGDQHGNACDLCPEFNDNEDADDDGVPDGCDICPGFDDNADDDLDGVPDDCDNCPHDANSGQDDNDEDTVGDACDNCPEHYNPGQEDGNDNDIGDVCDYVCSDTDGDRLINILDIVYLINFLYKSGLAPEPLESADVNHDEFVNILDIVYIINFIYKNGPEPVCYI